MWCIESQRIVEMSSRLQWVIKEKRENKKPKEQVVNPRKILTDIKPTMEVRKC